MCKDVEKLAEITPKGLVGTLVVECTLGKAVLYCDRFGDGEVITNLGEITYAYGEDTTAHILNLYYSLGVEKIILIGDDKGVASYIIQDFHERTG